MTDTDLRVRFAPSPTGYLHVGGVRTALFNWLHARKLGGAFLLRIEDTDRNRSSDEHTQVILDGLRWIGLDWDEEVVFQGAGLERHQAVADRLVASGHAYEHDGAIWFRMPHERIAWPDLVHGEIAFDGADIKDWVILRSDRTPTYNLSVVADDIDMRITEVLRGDDHISNTPKQIAVYRALGEPLPVFGHVPNVLGPDGKKLSKRHGATAIGDYRRAGFLPAAMRNFLALLGWNPGTDRELYFTTDELVAAFQIENVQKKSGVFDVTKLEWMNGQYLSQLPPSELETLVRADAAAHRPDLVLPGSARLQEILAVVRERSRVTDDLTRQAAVRLDATYIERDDKADKAIAKDPDAFRAALGAARERLAGVPAEDWRADHLEAAIRDLAERMGLKLGQVMQPVRIAVTGGTVSEGVPDLLAIVGRDETLKRLETAEGWEADRT